MASCSSAAVPVFGGGSGNCYYYSGGSGVAATIAAAASSASASCFPSTPFSSVLAGEDVGAVVLDIGGSTCRIGYAGEDGPKQVWNSCAGKSLLLPDDQCYGHDLIFPLCFLAKRDAVEVRPCLYNRGRHKFLNEDVFETLVSMTCEGLSPMQRRRPEYSNGGSSLYSVRHQQRNNVQHYFHQHQFGSNGRGKDTSCGQSSYCCCSCCPSCISSSFGCTIASSPCCTNITSPTSPSTCSNCCSYLSSTTLNPSSSSGSISSLNAHQITKGGRGGGGGGGTAGGERVIHQLQHHHHHPSHQCSLCCCSSVSYDDDYGECTGTPLGDRYRFGGLGIDLRDHPVLLTEPTRHSRNVREKMIELLFERFDAPAAFLAKQAVLSAFAVGRASGLVVDIGATGTCVAQVIDGYALQKGIMDFPVGGDCLDMQFSHLLAEQQLPIYPIYAVKKVLKDPGSGSGVVLDLFKVDITNVHPSYLQYSQYETVRKLKEAICRVAEDKQDIINAQTPISLPRVGVAPSSTTTTTAGAGSITHNNYYTSSVSVTAGSTSFSSSILSSSTSVTSAAPPNCSPTFLQHANAIQYRELPDGTKLDVEYYMHKVPEILFTPSLIRCSSENFLRGFKGLPLSIADCVNKCDVDLRRDLLNAIILTGGSSLIPGLSERLSRELQQNEKSLGGAVRFRVVSPTYIERRFSAWIGGSILASLGTFQQMWISNEEYKEHGTLIAERKCS